MALYGIGGKPGSGKSYWVVHHMLTKYFSWDKTHGEWVKRMPVEIVTNVDELKLDHFPLGEMMERSGKDGKGGNIETFFNVEYQRKLLVRFPRIIYLIDEAGQYFPKGFKVTEVLFFFQYHRHLGIDIYLISSALEDVSLSLLRLMEYRLDAKERSKRVLNEFRYVKYVGGVKAGSTILRGEARIFNLYKSMMADETEKIRSVTRKYVVWGAVCVCCGVLMFRYTAHSMLSPKVADSQGVHSVESGKVLKVSPPVTGKSERVIEPGSASGVPLAEQGVKGVTKNEELVSGKVEKGVDLLRLKSDYVQVRLSRDLDGNPIVYCDDGRFFDKNEVSCILREGLRIGEAIYIKRKVLEERGSEGTADRMGARPRQGSESRPGGGVSQANRKGAVGSEAVGKVQRFATGSGFEK